MAGTLIDFAGLPGVEVILRRSTGLEPDGSQVVLVVDDTFPDGWSLPVRRRTDPPTVAPASPAPLEALRAPGSGPVEETASPKLLPEEGTLTLAEVLPAVDAQDAEARTLVVGGLLVSSWEVEMSRTGARLLVLSLTDIRALWDRGFLPRWSFNRLKADGEHAEDTLDEGETWTLANLLRKVVVPALWGQPRLARVPEAWERVVASWEFPRYCRAVDALRRLLEKHPARVALHLDGSVGCYLEGEGRVGYSPGQDPENPDELPAGYVLDEEERRSRSYRRPPGFVVIGGGPRIATVAIDGWEPVLFLDGEFVPIRVGVARLLDGTAGRGLAEEVASLRNRIARTRDAGGEPDAGALALLDGLERRLREEQSKPPREATDEEMAFVRRFVLRGDAAQSDKRLTHAAAQVLKEQAFRLWRLPGAETYNAHLLPLLDRAETDAQGRRLEPLVESYRARIRMATLTNLVRGDRPGADVGSTQGRPVSDAERALRQAERDRETIKRRVLEAGFTLGPPNAPAFERGPQAITEWIVRFRASEPPRSEEFGPDRLLETRSRVSGLLEQIRFAEFAGEAVPGDADRYLDALERRAKALDDLDPYSTAGLELELAKTLREAAQELADTDDREAVRNGGKIAHAVELQRQIREKHRQREEANKTGSAENDALDFQEGKANATTHLVNDPRSPDPGARVFDRLAGVVKTPEPAGWVENVEVPTFSDTALLPHEQTPVRVQFGTSLRPRLPGQRPPTGGGPKQRSIVPFETPTSDQDAYFARVYRVDGPGQVKAVKFDEVPPGEGLTVTDERLVELIRLSGDTNVRELERQAEELAVGQSLELEAVEGARYRYLRPWPVNPNGRVAGVEVASRPNAIGFSTLVVVGPPRAVFDGRVTRTRTPTPGLPKQAPRAEDP